MSTVVTKNVQVGTSGTPAQNFTLYQPASPDGTVRLANGNSGSTTDLLTMTAAGNLGLGVTPSAWGSNNRAYQVAPTGVAWTPALSYVGGEANFSHNCYHDGTSWRFAGTGFGATRLEAGIQGAFRWFSSGNVSGTAGNAISFTQAMTLDASGRLGVGATAPSAGVQIRGTTTSDLSALRITNTTGGLTNADVDFRMNNDGAAQLRMYGAYPIQFFTNNAEAARIDSSGNLLVGTTSAGAMITAKTQTASGSALATLGTSGDTSFQAVLITKFDNNSTTSQNFIQFQINNGGANCGKITANGANTAAFGSTSDQRVKENIVNLPPQLANIMALRPVEYDYIESYGGGHQIGFIAQEVQQVYPDVISEEDTKEKILSITGWSKTEARLVKAIQEQQAIITALTARIESLESK